VRDMVEGRRSGRPWHENASNRQRRRRRKEGRKKKMVSLLLIAFQQRGELNVM